MNAVRIQTEDFNTGAELAALVKDGGDVGAVTSFVGVVRSDESLTALTLEHYPSMTEAEIGRIVEEADERWPLNGITVVHRVGRLTPGENIVLVAVASSHRATAFQACEFLIDYLKTRAPFWKQEERGDAVNWVEAKSSDDAQAARWQQ